MIRQTLEHISGVSIYPLISFTIFFIFFLILLVYVITLKKSHILTDGTKAKWNLK